MEENIAGTLFDEKFDNHDFILSIRQLQETLSDKDKIGETVLRWTDYDQPPMYYVKATEYINLYLKFKTEDLHLYRWGMNVFAPLGAFFYLNLILYVFNI